MLLYGNIQIEIINLSSSHDKSTDALENENIIYTYINMLVRRRRRHRLPYTHSIK